MSNLSDRNGPRAMKEIERQEKLRQRGLESVKRAEIINSQLARRPPNAANARPPRWAPDPPPAPTTPAQRDDIKDDPPEPSRQSRVYLQRAYIEFHKAESGDRLMKNRAAIHWGIARGYVSPNDAVFYPNGVQQRVYEELRSPEMAAEFATDEIRRMQAASTAVSAAVAAQGEDSRG